MLAKILKHHFKVSIVIYAVLYLGKTFVIFRFTNPFEWIINIPDYRNEQRGLILAGYISYCFIVTVNFLERYEDKKKRQAESDEKQ